MEKEGILFTFSPNHPIPPKKRGADCKESPLIWRFKQQLDESYQEQKTITQSPSGQSQTLSLQIASTTSYNHSTSIMQQKSSNNSSVKTFMDVLQDKLHRPMVKSKIRPFSSARTYLSRHVATPIHVDRHRMRELKYRSLQKNRISQLRQERRSILQQIDSELQRHKNWASKRSHEKCCSCSCQGRKEVGTKTSDKITQTAASSNKLSTQSAVQMDTIENQLESNQTTVFIEDPLPSKMMKGILSMKERMKVQRDFNEIQPEKAAEGVEWYMLPEHMLPEDLLKDHKTVSFRHVSECDRNSEDRSGQSQSLTRVLECLLTNQFLSDSKGEESRIENMFTFGELERSRMKAQIQMIKRHMKKVSIELEEKENINNHQKMLSA